MMKLSDFAFNFNLRHYMMGIAPPVQPPVPDGVDPKTIPCEHFKRGRCVKADNCKFSHERIRPKKRMDLSGDGGGGNGENAETMADWDQAQLESVIAEMHGGEVQVDPGSIPELPNAHPGYRPQIAPGLTPG